METGNDSFGRVFGYPDTQPDFQQTPVPFKIIKDKV